MTMEFDDLNDEEKNAYVNGYYGLKGNEAVFALHGSGPDATPVEKAYLAIGLLQTESPGAKTFAIRTLGELIQANL